MSELTCELNGIKYLKYCITVPVDRNIGKQFEEYLRKYDGIETGIEYKREGGWLSGLNIVAISFLIPENRVIEFSKSKFAI